MKLTRVSILLMYRYFMNQILGLQDRADVGNKQVQFALPQHNNPSPTESADLTKPEITLSPPTAGAARLDPNHCVFN